VLIISETLDTHEISVSCIGIDVSLHIALHIRLDDWATKSSNLISQVLENLDTVVGFVVGTLANNSRWMNDGVHGCVVLAFSRIRVAENGVLKDCRGIVEGMTWRKERTAISLVTCVNICGRNFPYIPGSCGSAAGYASAGQLARVRKYPMLFFCIGIKDLTPVEAY
jgi:hypothetical protein